MLTPKEEADKKPLYSEALVARLKKTSTPYADIQETLNRLEIPYKVDNGHHLRCNEEVDILEKLAHAF